MKTAHRLPTLLPLLAVACLAAGCNLVAPDSSGLVAQQDNDFFLLVTGLMLLVVVPVIGLVLFFAWRYRAAHALATHAADAHPAREPAWLVRVPDKTVAADFRVSAVASSNGTSSS